MFRMVCCNRIYKSHHLGIRSNAIQLTREIYPEIGIHNVRNYAPSLLGVTRLYHRT